MDWLVGTLFGVLQGLTEFLPVSSSGHLVLAQALFPHYAQPGITFEVVLHAGTLLAVLFWYRNEILKLDKTDIKYLIVGTIPAGIFGLAFNDFLEAAFAGTAVVGVTLIITGVANIVVDRITSKATLTTRSAFLVGLAQAVAILPGISRSGSTIFAGRLMGLSKKQAARFSFLLSVPAVAGANLVKFGELTSQAHPVGLYTAGFLAAFVSGVLAIGLVLKFLYANRFSYFGVYCIGVGVLTLALLV